MKLLMMLRLIVIVVLAWTSCSGQNIIFKDYKEFDSLSTRTKLIYFHFLGCSACKRMEKEVFTQKSIYEFINENFEAYSVLGFDEYEKEVRHKFKTQSNPDFIILDSLNNILHRFAGFYDEKAFMDQLVASFTDFSLANLELQYNDKKEDLLFMKEYISAKENAGELDSSDIFLFLDLYDENALSKEFLVNVLKYSYYDRIFNYKFGCKYHDILKQAYGSNEFVELKEYIRQRLLFINYVRFQELSKVDEKEECIRAIEELENGNHNLLQAINSSSIHAYLPERYPSFDLKYDLIKHSDTESKLNLLLSHTKKVGNDYKELNRIAWEIYTGIYDYDIEIGLELVQKSIDLDENYYNLDTYAALLFKKGELVRAIKAAQNAIDHAEQSNIDPYDTVQLLKKIEIKLNE